MKPRKLLLKKNVKETLQTTTTEEAFTNFRKPSLSDKEIKVVYDNTEEVFDNHNDSVQDSTGIDVQVDNVDEV